MKWIMPALILMCTVFVIAISVWRIDSVVLEKETLEAEINEYSYKWVENYYMEMDTLIQIFFAPDYAEDNYLSYFADTYEDRLEFWNAFSLLPDVLQGIVLVDDETGQSVYLDVQKQELSRNLPENVDSYLEFWEGFSVSIPYSITSFPIYSGKFGLDKPFILAEDSTKRCLIFLDYPKWRNELPEVLSRTVLDEKTVDSKLFTLKIEEGDQAFAEELAASYELDGFPLTMVSFDNDYYTGKSADGLIIPDALAGNVDLRYSAIARFRLQSGNKDFSEDDIFNDSMKVSVFGTGVWAVLEIDQKALMLEAVRIQLGAILLSYSALTLLIGLIFILYRYNRKAAKLVDEQRSFVANVSHELRTPLAVICNAGANLEQGFVTGEERVTKYGRMISEEGGRLSDMVESILLYSGFQLGRSKMERFDFELLMNEVIKPIEFLCAQRSIVFEYQVKPGLEFYGDREGLRSSAMNLLSNAVIHGGEGGWVGLFAGLSADGSFLEIRVEDRGYGISKAEHRKIFSAFSRGAAAEARAVPGSGLGLSLVKKVAALHGGRVEVESEPGKGAVFILKLAMREENGREETNTAG